MVTYVANCHGHCGDVNKEESKWAETEELGCVLGRRSGPLCCWRIITARGPRSRDPRGWNYVFRHKTIGMYGKQDYPQCINIEITAD